jgi:hypothetical protein
VPAFLPPRLVDFFVAAIGILSLLFAVCGLSHGVLNVNQSRCVGLCANGVHSYSRAAHVIGKYISLD